MAESNWKTLHRLLLEGLVIVFSVLLAFFVEDMRSDRQARSEVEEALAALDLEVQANLVQLESLAEVVTSRHERLVGLAPTIDGSLPFSEYRFGGWRVPELDVSAWARLSSDPVANRIAPDRLREAFLIYDYLEFLLRLDDQLFQFSFSPGFHDPDQAGVSYGIAEQILSQQIEFAEAMAELHRGFLERER